MRSVSRITKSANLPGSASPPGVSARRDISIPQNPPAAFSRRHELKETIRMKKFFGSKKFLGLTALLVVVIVVAVVLLPPLLGRLPMVVIGAMLSVTALQLFDRWTIQIFLKLLRREFASAQSMLLDFTIILFVTVAAVASSTSTRQTMGEEMRDSSSERVYWFSTASSMAVVSPPGPAPTITMCLAVETDLLKRTKHSQTSRKFQERVLATSG